MLTFENFVVFDYTDRLERIREVCHEGRWSGKNKIFTIGREEQLDLNVMDFLEDLNVTVLSIPPVMTVSELEQLIETTWNAMRSTPGDFFGILKKPPVATPERKYGKLSQALIDRVVDGRSTPLWYDAANEIVWQLMPSTFLVLDDAGEELRQFFELFVAEFLASEGV